MPKTSQALNSLILHNDETLEKRYHANKSELLALIYRTRIFLSNDGRGTGKSTGPLTSRIYDFIHLMPGGLTLIICDSFKHIVETIMPTLFTSLGKKGLRQDENFWVNKFPPDGVPRPIQAITDPKGFVFFDTGHCFCYVSTNFSSHANGKSVDAIVLEEAKLLKWNRVKENLLMLRGNKEYFGHLWCHHSITIITDMSEDPNHWTYEYYNKVDADLLKLIASLDFRQQKLTNILDNTKVEAKKNQLKKEIVSLEERLNFYRRHAVLVTNNSSIQNLHALGYSVIEDYLSYPAQDVMLNIMSIKPTKSNKYYYELLTDEKHGFIAKNWTFIDALLDKNSPLDGRIDTGEDDDRELEISMDWNNNIITMVVGQMFRKELRLLQEFWSYGEKDPIETCVNKFCEYNRFRKNKSVKLWFDHTADCLNASHDKKYWERVKAAFDANDWYFIKQKYAQTTHDDRYIIYKRILSGDVTAPFQLRFETENLTNWYQAAKAVHKVMRKKNRKDPKSKITIMYDVIEKDKSSENDKKPKINANSVPLEQQSHITEAADGLVVGNWNKLNQRKTGGIPIR